MLAPCAVPVRAGASAAGLRIWKVNGLRRKRFVVHPVPGPASLISLALLPRCLMLYHCVGNDCTYHKSKDEQAAVNQQ
jgi:hypothetical protein